VNVVVETTGTQAGIAEALRQVATGGTVVLAVRPLDPVTMVRTYADIHRRGIRLVCRHE
jgi:threonine dehydrogenase-like Zn-dependent dehydrogenase